MNSYSPKIINKTKIVGSEALYRLGYISKPNSDVDLVSTNIDQVQEFFIQKEIDPNSLIRYDIHYMPETLVDMFIVEGDVVCLDHLYTLKLSHLAWPNPFWVKHFDHAVFMKKKGATIDLDLYNKLKDHWTEIFGDKSFLSLNQTKDEFFNDNVDYLFDHDWLHKLHSWPEDPVYKSCLKGEVEICRKKFEALPYSEKIKMFQEELYVILFERFILRDNNNNQFSPLYMYSRALQKLCTTLTKGWATDFILFNCDKFQKLVPAKIKNLNYIAKIRRQHDYQ